MIRIITSNHKGEYITKNRNAKTGKNKFKVIEFKSLIEIAELDLDKFNFLGSITCVKVYIKRIKFREEH